MHLHGTAASSSHRSSTGWPASMATARYSPRFRRPLEAPFEIRRIRPGGRRPRFLQGNEIDGLFIAKFFSKRSDKRQPIENGGLTAQRDVHPEPHQTPHLPIGGRGMHASGCQEMAAIYADISNPIPSRSIDRNTSQAMMAKTRSIFAPGSRKKDRRPGRSRNRPGQPDLRDDRFRHPARLRRQGFC
jgi:hypothetical protein